MTKLIQLTTDKADGKPVHVGIIHADAFDDAKKLQGQLQSQLDCKQAEIYEISPVIGAHVGPGTVGVAVYPEE